MASKRKPRIAIVSSRRDLHALAVAGCINDSAAARCHVVPGDAIAGTAAISWSSESNSSTLPTVEGEEVCTRELDVIWWRRVCREQCEDASGRLPEAERDLINNDCRFSLLGVLLTDFDGTWVSDPFCTRRAENKLLQLRVAQRAGFEIPDTLVSQNPEAIGSFFQRHGGKVIAKAVRGTRRTPLLTGAMTAEMVANVGSLSLSPTIYQPEVRGHEHLRVQVFGQAVYAAGIESTQLDWRVDYRSPMRHISIDPAVALQLRAVLQELGLRMGVFDLKVREEDGALIWLELNSQGQFLFLEPLTGLPLLDAFSAYLAEEAHLSVTKRG